MSDILRVVGQRIGQELALELEMKMRMKHSGTS